MTLKKGIAICVFAAGALLCGSMAKRFLPGRLQDKHPSTMGDWSGDDRQKPTPPKANSKVPGTTLDEDKPLQSPAGVAVLDMQGEVNRKSLTDLGLESRVATAIVKLADESRTAVSRKWAENLQSDPRPNVARSPGWESLMIPGSPELGKQELAKFKAKLKGVCSANAAEQISRSLDHASQAAFFGAADIYLAVPPKGAERDTGYVKIQMFDPSTGNKICEIESINPFMTKALLGEAVVEAISNRTAQER